MNNNNQIDYNNTKGLREFYSMQEFVSALSRLQTVWCWGAHAWTKMNNYVLRCKVQAHRHKGHIYFCVNGADLFDVYLTTTKGRIVKEFKDIYVEDVVRIIDTEIELIPEYKS